MATTSDADAGGVMMDAPQPPCANTESGIQRRLRAHQDNARDERLGVLYACRTNMTKP